MEEPKKEERHYKIWDDDYFIELFPKKKVGIDKNVSIEGKVKYIKKCFEHKEEQTGKFRERWRYNDKGDCYYSLIIELEKDNPKKKIKILNFIDGTNSIFKEKAFESFLENWREIPFENLGN